MKKILFLMVAALVIAGCSKDKTIIEKEPIKLNQQNIVINYQEDIKVLIYVIAAIALKTNTSYVFYF